MKKYRVKVAVRILEVYEVDAENPETASEDWFGGNLIHTSDEALDSEILSVKEV
jgi:hypothetical protein